MANFNVQTGGYTVSPVNWSGNSSVGGYSLSTGNVAAANSSTTFLNKTSVDNANTVNSIPQFNKRPSTGVVYPRFLTE